jgi:hypothetical protein
MTRGWIPAVALVALMATAVALQTARDTAFPLQMAAGRFLVIRSGAVLQKVALSYRALLADVYWVRAIQHYGGTRRSIDPKKTYALLYPLLDLTTTLDPLFGIAYRFGAIFLAEPHPGGAGRPDLALTLLEKGMRAHPGTWQYQQDAGFVCYWWVRDYKTAAEWFRRASQVPGAPWWLESLAAVTLAQGGDRRGSRLLWEQLAKTADNAWLRNEATRRLVQLDALGQIDRLEGLIAECARRTGRRPGTWSDLVREGLLTGTPLDPAGTPYLLDAGSGSVTVSNQSILWPLPIEARGSRPNPDLRSPIPES